MTTQKDSLRRERRAAWQAYLLLSLASLAWAGNAVVSRVAVGEVSPMVLTCLRWTIVSLIFLFLRGRRLRDDMRLLLPHWRTGLWMGAIGYTVFSAVLYIAAYYTQAVNLAILQGAIPVYVLVPMTLIVLVLWLDVMNVPRGWQGVWHLSFWVGAALISLRT